MSTIEEYWWVTISLLIGEDKVPIRKWHFNTEADAQDYVDSIEKREVADFMENGISARFDGYAFAVEMTHHLNICDDIHKNVYYRQLTEVELEGTAP